MPNNPSRRWVLSAGAASAALMVAQPVFAITTAQAEALIDRMIAELNGIINSGRTAQQMFGDFERLFAKYADVPRIAQFTLGVDRRRASASQFREFTKAFQGYMARKYGKRFREFVGGKVEVREARQVKSFYLIKTMAILRGEPPFEVTFRVSNNSGRLLFDDMVIEGISLLKSEKAEIGAMLDRRKGNLDAMINDLKRAG